jgi:hypothetical protein
MFCGMKEWSDVTTRKPLQTINENILLKTNQEKNMTTQAAETTEVKPIYVGMWIKEDKNGNTFLSGNDDDTAYCLFRDKNDATKRTMSTLNKKIPGAKWTTGAVFDELKKDGDTPYFKSGNMCVYLNDRREEGKNHPNFNLVIYNDKA